MTLLFFQNICDTRIATINNWSQKRNNDDIVMPSSDSVLPVSSEDVVGVVWSLLLPSARRKEDFTTADAAEAERAF